MSNSPGTHPTATVTITAPLPSPTVSVGVNTRVTVKGNVAWSPAQVGFISAIRLAIVRASDDQLISVGGLATASDVTPSGFSWSRTLTADKEVDAGLLRASAMDQSFEEVARAEVAIRVTPPVVTVVVDRPAAGATIGIDQVIDVAGSVTWVPAKPNFVDSVRISLLRKATLAVLDSTVAMITEVGAGTRNWAGRLATDQAVPEALIRAAARDAHGNPLVVTDIEVAIPTPDVTLTIASPASSPVPAFDVNTPIPVDVNLAWAPSSPDFVRDVLIQLIRSADGLVVDSKHAAITPVSSGIAAAHGSVRTPDHLIDAAIRVHAFDKFSNQVAQKEVAIRIP